MTLTEQIRTDKKKIRGTLITLIEQTDKKENKGRLTLMSLNNCTFYFFFLSVFICLISVISVLFFYYTSVLFFSS